MRRLLDDHLHGKVDRKEELFSLWILDLWHRRHRVQTAADGPLAIRAPKASAVQSDAQAAMAASTA